MARRSLNPIGIPDTPNPTTDPVMLERLRAKLLIGQAQVEQSYLAMKAAAFDGNAFNNDLARLKRAVSRPGKSVAKETRLHPLLELTINQRGRTIANGLGVPMAEVHVREAAADVARNIRGLRRRPPNDVLRFHVEALMALVQELSGLPVSATRTVNRVYAPQLSKGVSQFLRIFFAKVDPAVTEIALVNIVCAARRKYAAKPMRFVDFFPFETPARLDNQGWPKVRPGFRLEHFEPIIPIYCT